MVRFAHKCALCHSTETKYACPKCNERLCSSDCYKAHSCSYESVTDNAAGDLSESEDRISDSNEEGEVTSDEEATQSHVIQDRFLKLLMQSDQLKYILKFRSLQSKLKEVIKSQSPKVQIKQLMADPDFRIFCDECLKALGIDRKLNTL